MTLDEPSEPREPCREELIWLDMDTRLVGVWEVFWQYESDLNVFTVAVLMRMAYAGGYTEALREPRRGEFFRQHGIPVPKRRDAKK